MREIKFRGKRIDNGEFVYGSLIRIESEYVVFGSEKTRSFIIVSDTIEIDCFYTGPFISLANDVLSVKEESVGQCTGLKDKNGVEIYFDDALTNGEMTRRVIWREEDSQIQLSVNDDNYDNRIKLTQQVIDTFGLTICGNIYENPELLETKNLASAENTN